MSRLPDRCFLIVDPKGSAHELAQKIHRNLERRISGLFEINEVNFSQFSAGEVYLQVDRNVRRSMCFYIADSRDDPQYWLFKTGLVNHTLKNSSAGEIIDVLPNLNYSRQDRKDKARVPITARYAADIIKKDSNAVLTVDVHSQQIQGFYDRFDSLPSFRTLAEHLQRYHPKLLHKNLAIASPDAGGGKRAEGFAKRIKNQNVAIGFKVRSNGGPNDQGVEEIRFAEEQIKGKDILLIDDIGDSFGTIEEAYEELKNKGAKKVYAYTTHAFFTKGYEVVNKLDHLFIGDTVKQPFGKEKPTPEQSKKMETIKFGPIISEAIYKTSLGESLSKTFEDFDDED